MNTKQFLLYILQSSSYFNHQFRDRNRRKKRVIEAPTKDKWIIGGKLRSFINPIP